MTKLTQWAAQFLAASELSRRGYQVSFTMGNAPDADLVVRSPGDNLFMIDVKGQAQKSGWRVRKKERIETLYYILVYVSPLKPQPRDDRFFILTQAEFNQLIDEFPKKHPNNKGNIPGFMWKEAEGFLDKWETLPDCPR